MLELLQIHQETQERASSLGSKKTSASLQLQGNLGTQFLRHIHEYIPISSPSIPFFFSDP